MSYSYPFPHAVVGNHIIGRPAKRQYQTIKGLGATQQPRYVYRPITRNVYNNYGGGYYPYGSGYNPLAIDALLLAQGNWNYGATPYGTSPYQNYNYNPYYNGSYYGSGYSYPYYGSGYGTSLNQSSTPQYTYTNYQGCVGSGGLWDSFANACTQVNTGFNPYSYESTPYGYGGGYIASQTGAMPQVVGLSMGSGVAELNQAGYTVWLISQNGIPQGTPPGYVQNRAVITVNNGIITSVYQG